MLKNPLAIESATTPIPLFLSLLSAIRLLLPVCYKLQCHAVFSLITVCCAGNLFCAVMEYNFSSPCAVSCLFSISSYCETSTVLRYNNKHAITPLIPKIINLSSNLNIIKPDFLKDSISAAVSWQSILPNREMLLRQLKM